MSEKLSLIPVTAASLAATDLLYLAADQGGGSFLENKLPVSVVDGRFVLKSGDVVAGNLYVTGLGTSGVAAPPMLNNQFTVQDALTQTSLLIFNNRNPGGAAGSGGAAALFLWSNTLSPYAWIIRADGATDTLLFQDEGFGNHAYIQAQANPAFGIGSPAPAMSVLFHRIADGRLMITNSAATDFRSLDFGGTTSAFPRIGRSGIFLEFLAADGTSTASTALYNIKTDATNFERITTEWSANVARLWTEKGSVGGTARAFVLGADATELLRFGSATTLSFFGATPVVQQSVPDGSTLAVVIDALQALGLFAP